MRKKALKNAVKRVIRGGSYYNDFWILRATDRVRVVPVYRVRRYGLRLIARTK